VKTRTRTSIDCSALWLLACLGLVLAAGCNEGDDDDSAMDDDDVADDDDSADPDAPPTWDEEAAAIDCAHGSVEAPLMALALEDAGLTLDEVGYTEGDWANASYASRLDDPFLLPWFYDYHWEPLLYPCLGGQAGVDLDHAATTAHPVATALGEAMALLDEPREAEPIDPLAAEQGWVDLGDLPADLAEALVPILAAMEQIAGVREALADGAPAELQDLVIYGHGGVLIDFQSAPDLVDTSVQDWVLGETGPRSLYDPARVLAFAVEEADLTRFAGVEATLDVDTDLGRVVVAGPGADAPGDIDEVALYLDLGGDDTYTHAAGASYMDVPVGVHIDLGGDDVYGYEERDEGTEALLPSDEDGRYQGDFNYGRLSLSRVGRQGSGRMGVGMLFDYGEGADHYQSLRVSQGWGHLGVGVLYDDGGDDTYLGEAGVQGAASMGIGLFMDVDGDDVHETFTDSQGFGYLQAVGIAWDGGGNDVWYANPGKEEDGGTTIYYSPQLPGNGNSTFGQGAGFGMRWDSEGTFLSGGVGILRDASGDDAYTAGTFAQGSGYWQAVGLLLDGDGADEYDAYYYVQGGAAHYAAGVLLDDGAGDDRLNTNMTPNYMMIGAGHDFSVGVYVNEAGDESYVYAGLAGGASNCQGIGLFVENDGTDDYQISSTYSTGLGNHSGECDSPPRTNVDSIGLFIDSGGDPDVYGWPDADDHPVPDNDSSFGHDQSGSDTEKGGAVDGDGETGAHAGGAVPS